MGEKGRREGDPGRCNRKLGGRDLMRRKLTNRRSRGPCRTEALIVDRFIGRSRSSGSMSEIAEGAIGNDDNGTW